MAISRCDDRLATTVPPKGQIPFHHFSPFRGNVEIISIVHSPLFSFPLLAGRIGGHSPARIVRALLLPLIPGWTLRLFPLRAANEGHSPFSLTHPPLRRQDAAHLPLGRATIPILFFTL